MLQVYLNYPNSRISIHNNAACGTIKQMRKPDQREVKIDLGSLTTELAAFKSEYSFASEASHNDMWVTVEMQDQSFETSIIAYVKKLLGARYKRFRDAGIEEHC